MKEMNLVYLVFIICFLHFSFTRTLDKYLEFLDSEIVKQLMYPVKDDRNSLYDKINSYNTGLYDIGQAYSEKAEHVMPIVNALKKLGKPQFVQAPVDFKHLKKTLDWEDIQMTHLKCLMEDTKKLWLKIENPTIRVSGEYKSSFQEGSYL